MSPGPRPSLVRPEATRRDLFSMWEILILAWSRQSTSQSLSPDSDNSWLIISSILVTNLTVNVVSPSHFSLLCRTLSIMSDMIINNNNVTDHNI